MTSKLLTTYKQKITDLTLIPVGGGAFELSLDGELLYSKLATGKFPDEEWTVTAVGERLNKPAAKPAAVKRG